MVIYVNKPLIKENFYLSRIIIRVTQLFIFFVKDFGEFNGIKF